MKTNTWSHVATAIMGPDFTIDLTFEDGKHGIFDMKSRLDYQCWAPLKEKSLFMQGKAQDGTVCWPENIDIAPETLYEECV